MIRDRMIEYSDLPLLGVSLAKDEYHKGTDPEFFVAPGTVCKVYEDDAGPVIFVRASKALRLDVQYVDNTDKKRNMQVMLDGFNKLAIKARENGFQEIIFNTTNPRLRKFCMKAFGFVDSCGELRKLI